MSARTDRDTDGFDNWNAFVPQHIPESGPFPERHAVLMGDDHAAFHRLTRALFEERGVYDATFGYNLARLNLDRRHPNAGFRYAVDADDRSVLRAEFTPTTEFCPAADALITLLIRSKAASNLVHIRQSGIHCSPVVSEHVRGRTVAARGRTVVYDR